LRKLEHQVHAGDPLRQRIPEQTRGPHHRLSARVDQATILDDTPQVLIVPHRYELRCVDRDMLHVLAALDHILDPVERHLHVKAVDATAEHVCGVARVRVPLGRAGRHAAGSIESDVSSRSVSVWATRSPASSKRMPVDG
jgi:hypothetical protein